MELKTIQIEQIDNIEQIYYDVKEADCYKEGSVRIRRLDIINGELPYTYRFENTVTRQLFHDPGSLREGEAIVYDRNGAERHKFIAQPSFFSA